MPEFVDVARIVVAGMEIGYSERDILSMTPRHFYMIRQAYNTMKGVKTKPKVASIDDL